jgi:uncharacterized protein YaiE (UPF0345 family)
MPSFLTYNGPMLTTAAYAPVTTGTATKTMLQVKAPSDQPITVWKWGLDFDGSGSTPIKCELIDTYAIAATVTAAVATLGTTQTIYPLGGLQIASRVQVGTTATGYTSTSEGSIVQTRVGSLNSVLPGNGDRNEWSLGREFVIPAGNTVRIRVTTATAFNCLCYLCWDE